MQCEARIRTSFELPDPRGRRCGLAADGPVCGVWLCWQHRKVVTQWVDGVEQLAPRAEKEFEAWGVVPTERFVPMP